MLSSLVLVGSLLGCAAESSTTDAKESSQQFSTDEKKPGADSEHQDFVGQAVISVAGVDVDGINASAAGYVTQVIQDGLQCEFTFTKDTAIVKRTSASVVDRSGSSCGVVSVPTSELARGTWEVKLFVTGADQEIVSDALTMEVP